jgi:hypothetical protein
MISKNDFRENEKQFIEEADKKVFCRNQIPALMSVLL